MTICIAAMCEDQKTIIMVADRRIGIGTGEMEADIGIKIHKLLPNWFALVAGNDVDAAHEVAFRASGVLGEKTDNVTTMDVRDELANAYNKVRMYRAEAEHLTSRGWSLDEFKKDGNKSLPETKFAEIDGALERYDLGVELIACGFASQNEYADIVAVCNPGVGTFHSASHFAAIGTGATAATFALFTREFHFNLSLPLAIYYIYEAKVAAERASGVGQPTVMHVFRKDQDKSVPIDQEEQKQLDAIRRQLAPTLPSEDHLETIKSFESLKKFPPTP